MSTLSDPAPLILSLALDPVSFKVLDDLRRRHFPAERNVLLAHITLFHKLPGEELDAICRTLEARERVERFAFRGAVMRP